MAESALITIGLSDQFDPLLGALSADLGQFGLTGCQMLCSCGLDVTCLTLDGRGNGRRSVRVPDNPSLCNLPLCWQGYALAPGANPAGAIVSNGVRCRVGV